MKKGEEKREKESTRKQKMGFGQHFNKLLPVDKYHR